MADFPELEKLRSIEPQSQVIGDFIEWLGANGLTICEHRPSYGGEYIPTRKTRDTLLSEHFGIDRNRVEAEKRAIIADFTNSQKAA